MPGVAVLPVPSLNLAGKFGPDLHNGTYLPRQPVNLPVDSPTMNNGLSSWSVQEIRELKPLPNRPVRVAQSKDAARDLKTALHAFHVAGTLVSTYTTHPSYAADRITGSAGNNEFLQFYQVRIMPLVSRAAQ